MLRITIHDSSRTLRFIIEGRLAGDCVSELERCWETALITKARPSIFIDLTSLTFIDACGKQLLARLHEDGATLIGTGIMAKEIVKEIRNAGG